MMDEVSASGFAGDEDAREISGLGGEPRVRRMRRIKPVEGGDSIVNGGGEAVFGSETVIGGDDDGGEGGGEAESAVVEVSPGARTDAEAAAVEVEEDGELGGD